VTNNHNNKMVVNSYGSCCIRTCAFHSVGNYPACGN
jgi:hypothetical protein